MSFKVLHHTLSNGQRVFNWPRQDDTVHSSCVYFGPAVIVGIGPFNFPQLNEANQVYHWLKKSKKGTEITVIMLTLASQRVIASLLSLS